MIMMQSPSLAINSCDVPGPNYRMWETVNAQKGMTPMMLLNEIVRVNRLALEYKQTQLLNVIVNCHGGSGRLYIGGGNSSPLDINSVGVLSPLKGRNIGTIWLVACKAAEGVTGKHFCQTLASVTGSQVVASDKSQEVEWWGAVRIVQGGGRGQIDEYEGKVFSFTPIGQIGEIDPHNDIFTILD
jgi:hypothetical protein